MHSGTSTSGAGVAQDHVLDQLGEGGRHNDPFSSSNYNATTTTGATSTDDLLSRNATSTQRPGLSSDVGSTTAIRDGVPGATSGSGLTPPETDMSVAGDPNAIGGFAEGRTLDHFEESGTHSNLLSSESEPIPASDTATMNSSTGPTERDTTLAGDTSASVYETDAHLDLAGQTAGTTASPAAQSTLQTDETTASSGLTGNAYPDRSIGR